MKKSNLLVESKYFLFQKIRFTADNNSRNPILNGFHNRKQQKILRSESEAAKKKLHRIHLFISAIANSLFSFNALKVFLMIQDELEDKSNYRTLNNLELKHIKISKSNLFFITHRFSFYYDQR